MDTKRKYLIDYFILVVFSFLGQIAGTGKNIINLDFGFITFYSFVVSIFSFSTIYLVRHVLLWIDKRIDPRKDPEQIQIEMPKTLFGKIIDLSISFIVIVMILAVIVFSDLRDWIGWLGMIVVAVRMIDRKKQY